MSSQTWRALVGPAFVVLGSVSMAVSVQGWAAVFDPQMLGFVGAMAVLGGAIQLGQFFAARTTRRRFREYELLHRDPAGRTVALKRTGSEIGALRDVIAVGAAVGADPRQLGEVHVVRADESGLAFVNVLNGGDTRTVVEVPWANVQGVGRTSVREGMASYLGMQVQVHDPRSPESTMPIPMVLWNEDSRVGGVAGVDVVDRAVEAFAARCALAVESGVGRERRINRGADR